MDYISWIRSYVGNERVLLPSTAVIVTNLDGQILLQLRSDLGLWGCPGGMVEIGETVIESATREVREEAGVTIEAPVLFGVYSGPEYFATYPNGDRTAVVQTVLLARHYRGVPTPGDESREIAFFSPFDLPDALAPHHAPFLGHYLEWLEGVREIPVLA